MKRVGLITVTYANNFGSNLQSFALQEALKRLDCIPEIINIDSARPDIEKRRKKYVLSRIFDMGELRAYFPILIRRIALRTDKEYHDIYANRAAQFRKFASERFQIAKKVEGWEGLTQQCRDSYDVVVIGSDQNWRPANIAGGFYTLEFVPDEINKVAYATSFGLDHIINVQKNKATHFLGRIGHLSVREESGRRIVKELLGRDIPVVSDPTFLLTAADWDAYISPIPVVKGDYILCYFLGANEEHWEFVKRLKAKTGLKIVGVPYGEIYKKGAASFIDEVPTDIGPFEFIRLIRDAAYVCTDSFHGCAFSINYNKDFFAFYKFIKNEKMSTNSRIDNMLEWSGLSSRLMHGHENIDHDMLVKMDYTETNVRLNQMRNMSLQYLIASLNDEGSTDLK